jgi:hypothetical protein
MRLLEDDLNEWKAARRALMVATTRLKIEWGEDARPELMAKVQWLQDECDAALARVQATYERSAPSDQRAASEGQGHLHSN